jgi:HD-GYP domain-containing protein (c-di-GMP phosphodiesterase class II)
LTDEEWRIMRSHPEVGRQLLERIPFLRDAIPVVYHHHERWDGTGYPLGLAGEAIPLAARIFAVADAFDAMTFDRTYSTAISMEAARERIREAVGTHFDPAVVVTFLAMPLAVFEAARARSLDRSIP